MSEIAEKTDHRQVARQILSFSWPVFISMIFTELYNITNSLIVGNYVSLKALSAVSACTWITNIFNYSFYGLGPLLWCKRSQETQTGSGFSDRLRFCGRYHSDVLFRDFIAFDHEDFQYRSGYLCRCLALSASLSAGQYSRAYLSDVFFYLTQFRRYPTSMIRLAGSR